MFNSISMTRLAASITGALGVDAPKEADKGIDQVAALWRTPSAKKRTR